MSDIPPAKIWGRLWTPLLQAAVQPQTSYQYANGLKHFVEWAWYEYGGPLMTAEEMDDALCEYGQHVFDVDGGRGKWRLNMALYGIEHYVPAFHEKLVLSRRSLKGWSLLRPPSAHPPITYGLALSLIHI